MSTRPEDFSVRHIGITDADITSMLAELKFQNLEEFLQSIVPESILDKSKDLLLQLSMLVFLLSLEM